MFIFVVVQYLCYFFVYLFYFLFIYCCIPIFILFFCLFIVVQNFNIYPTVWEYSSEVPKVLILSQDIRQTGVAGYQYLLVDEDEAASVIYANNTILHLDAELTPKAEAVSAVWTRRIFRCAYTSLEPFVASNRPHRTIGLEPQENMMNDLTLCTYALCQLSKSQSLFGRWRTINCQNR